MGMQEREQRNGLTTNSELNLFEIDSSVKQKTQQEIGSLNTISKYHGDNQTHDLSQIVSAKSNRQVINIFYFFKLLFKYIQDPNVFTNVVSKVII